MAQQHKADKKPNFIRHQHVESKKGKKTKSAAEVKAWKRQVRKDERNRPTSDGVIVATVVAHHSRCNCVTCLISGGNRENEERIRKSSPF